MRNLILAVALFVGAGALVSAQAQSADQKTAAVKPVGSASQTVLDSWNEIGRKLIAMAEDFPEDKYDFKPVPAQRTFAEQLLHASGVNYYFTNVVLGEKPPASENPPRDQFKSKAAIVEYVKKSFADGAAAIQKKGNSGMSTTVVDPYANRYVRVIDYAYGFIEHSGEHYGQLVVYYRVAGLVPPESRPKK
jgi:uncharacterized damage-inducible protein DinB